MEIKSLILAAGKGTRMKSVLPKVLHKVNGISMIGKVLKTLKEAGIKENILILGHKKELVLDEIGESIYVEQKEQLGTGHAVMQAKEKLENFNGTVLIVCGDTPLLKKESIKKIYTQHKENKATVTIMTAEFENPFGYGRIVKDEEGKVKAIVEEKEALEEIKKIKEVNTGVYCFDSKKLFKALEEINNDNEKGEYYLTDVIRILKDKNEIVEALKLEENSEVLGVNSRVHLSQATKILRERKNIEVMENGITLIDPETTYIEEEVEVGNNTTIYPGVILEGKTKIGENCKIIGATRIENSEIRDNVVIESSVIEEAIVKSNSAIGPFAHLRPKAEIGEEVKVGNFVEIKKAILHKGVKAGHLTYIGDSEIGEETNIGAGTITCNYDGVNKHKTIIGKKVFVGSDTKFVAPVVIGDEALIGAGSVITKDVPEKSLAVGRAKQFIKKGWNIKKR
ncbi:MAG: UDP-N-acetylglucosamine diphosphorylase/glucosamine-1-phosphate N-acetyltransferase [Fusobacteriia bacterium 4572_132]|nr:MAG: UDP-N-acetylglucosamine diphosphorylase/glucosamine-1-phosphate N-acetyltransferase [Fusobacteriia bacterium 4572_132]